MIKTGLFGVRFLLLYFLVMEASVSGFLSGIRYRSLIFLNSRPLRTVLTY